VATVHTEVEADGRVVRISNPDKPFFSARGETKLDLVRYYLAVGPGALRGVRERPTVLKRYPNGAEGEFFYQKRVPSPLPEWMETVTVTFPSGRSARELCPVDVAHLIWAVNLGCLDLNPWAVRRSDVDHPDELRVDLDPMPGVDWSQMVDVAYVAREVLDDAGLVGWPKTSGSRGMHVFVRIERRWTFDQVRRAALALAREVERRAPALATSKWWKEERHGVFLDYNQNAKDRTVAGAYSVRPTPDARVSAPLTWDEIGACDPADFTLTSMPARFVEIGDRHAAMDAHAGSIDALLELSARQEKDGLGDAPWPPHYRKQAGEAPRVAPSRRRAPGAPTKLEERRRAYPVIEIGRARQKADALAGFERWKARHPEAGAHLQPADVLVDAMRGRFRTWTRVRVNLQHVPEPLRPAQEPLDPDENLADDWIRHGRDG